MVGRQQDKEEDKLGEVGMHLWGDNQLKNEHHCGIKNMVIVLIATRS